MPSCLTHGRQVCFTYDYERAYASTPRPMILLSAVAVTQRFRHLRFHDIGIVGQVLSNGGCSIRQEGGVKEVVVHGLSAKASLECKGYSSIRHHTNTHTPTHLGVAPGREHTVPEIHRTRQYCVPVPNGVKIKLLVQFIKGFLATAQHHMEQQ